MSDDRALFDVSAPPVEEPEPEPMRDMTAADVKDALRKRHPAWSQGMVGEWTTIEEWLDVDLIAVSAWSRQKIIGYEVKVSRSDMRRELLNPDKRAAAVAGCHEFYFAVPHGLYTADELAYKEPDWEPEDFRRDTCPGIPSMGTPRHHSYAGIDIYPYGGRCTKYRGSKATVRVPVPKYHDYVSWGAGETDITCPTCEGKGYAGVSRVEREAPTLWVPRDVGLITITDRGCRVVKKAPSRTPEKPLIPKGAAKLVRYVSVRPDPRHLARRDDQEARNAA